MSYCAKCGAPLPPGAQFCPRCGTPVVQNAESAEHRQPAGRYAGFQPAGPRESGRQDAGVAAGWKPALRTAWWLVPLVLVVLGGVVWLLLAGLPFGGREREPETPRVETIAEGTVAPSSPPETGTIIDVPGERPEPEPEREPEPDRARESPTERDPAPDPQPDPRREPERPKLLDDEQASATVRGYVTSRNYYKGVEDDCVRVESRGFRNRGFDYEIWHSCERGGASRLLGRWRVDALTREVFRQYEDGRYLRP